MQCTYIHSDEKSYAGKTGRGGCGAREGGEEEGYPKRQPRERTKRPTGRRDKKAGAERRIYGAMKNSLSFAQRFRFNIDVN